MVEERPIEQPKAPLSLRHVLLVYASPRSLFARVEDTGVYGWALVTLLVVVVLVGYATVQTGLIDLDVARKTEQAKAEIEASQGDLVDRQDLRDRMEPVDKKGEFNRVMARLWAVVFTPVYLLGSFLLIASVFYALVALSGRKPEWHTLMSICVYSGFIELAGLLLGFAMMMYYGRLDVPTSLGALATPGEPSWLFALDPFRIWFWVLAAMGLTITQQLRRWVAITSCTMLCLVGMGARVAMQYAPL